MKKVRFFASLEMPMLNKEVNEFLEKGKHELVDVKLTVSGNYHYATVIYKDQAQNIASA